MFDFLKRRTAPETRTEPELQVTRIPVVEKSKPNRAPRRSGKGARYYSASDMTSRLDNWTTVPLTADQVITRNQRVLVARSRSEAAANDYLKAFLRLCSQNVVGPRGFALQAQARDENGELDTAANQALEAWWRQWQRAENCDVTGRRSFRLMCKGAVETAAKDGEFMFREIRGANAGPMRYQLQSVDPQRCPVDYDVDRLPGGRFVRQGIEFSREGRRLAYYFLTSDPASTGYSHGSHSLDRVPAEQIIHGYIEEIEGQRRGLPWAATSLWRLHMLGGFEKSALANARKGANLGGFIEWADGEGPDPDDALEDEELYLEAEDNMFQELPPGARVKPFQTTYPTGDFTPFTKSMIRGAGAGMGVSYVHLSNDLEGVNFSSIRQGVLDERDHWMDLQEWLIEKLVDRVYQNALEPALLLGIVRGPGVRLRPDRIAKYREVFWQGRRWSWVDPVKDVQAEVESKNNMLTAPSDIIRRRGEDPDTTWRAFAADINAMRAAGIPDEFIMAAVLGTGAGAASGDAPQDTDEEGSNAENTDD